MSDFLSNVTARALGTAPVVQPRVPSLFEPYRANEGPFVTRTAPNFADAGDEAESASDTSEVPRSRRAQFEPKDSVAMPHSAQPPAPAQTAMQEPSQHESPPSAARPEVAPAQANPTRIGATPREAPQPTASAQGVRPPGVPRGEALSATGRAVSDWQSAPSHEQSVPGPDPLPVAMPAVRPPVKRAMESSARRPVPLLRRAAVYANSGLPLPHLPIAEPVPAVRAPLAPAGEPAASPAFRSPAAKSDSAARADFLDRRLLPVLTQVPAQELLRPSSTSVQAAQPSAEIRPRAAEAAMVASPAARGTEAAKAAAAFAVPIPAEPSVEITIGTVEVRAVFPEKPAPRAPSRRPKPSVSLDEYLKRSSRGAR